MSLIRILELLSFVLLTSAAVAGVIELGIREGWRTRTIAVCVTLVGAAALGIATFFFGIGWYGVAITGAFVVLMGIVYGVSHGLRRFLEARRSAMGQDRP